MKIRILYDNKACQDNFKSGWGFSCLVDERVLFDTGEAADSLLHNMALSSIHLENIEAVIISHNHWDHTGGLPELLKRRPGLTVYGCPGFGPGFKQQVVEQGGRLIESPVFRRIDSQLAVTGEIPATYKDKPVPEQALIIDGAEGLTLITGCAHPGIPRMTALVHYYFPARPLYRIIGGFHLMDQDPGEIRSVVRQLKTMNIQSVGPAHCTGETAIQIFRKAFAQGFIEMSAGTVFEI